MMRQDLHLAYVLHTRPYRETSLLVEMFSAEHGRIAAVARGAKRGKAKTSSLLQLFTPLHISWFGNGDLVTLTAVEAREPGHNLPGRKAICGLYLNELLIKLVPKWDQCAALFNAYTTAIANLAIDAMSEQVLLRSFEMQLLQSLGYGLQLNKEVTTGAAIAADQYYVVDPLLGPRLVSPHDILAVRGASLLALTSGNFSDAAVLKDIKRMLRMVLRHHLGAKTIVSRELL